MASQGRTETGERAGRQEWTCPDCGPLEYATLMSGRGGLRACPRCGGLAERTDDPLAEDDPRDRMDYMTHPNFRPNVTHLSLAHRRGVIVRDPRAAQYRVAR